MTVGFVYCLENSCMPGIYKIGMTDRSPTQRCCELSNSTSVPTSFSLVFYVETDNANAIERELHAAFSKERVSYNREFFKCCPLLPYEWLRRNTDIYTEFYSYGFRTLLDAQPIHLPIEVR